VACLIAISFGATVQADVLTDTVDFNIPAQLLGRALLDFSRQSQVQVMGSADNYNGLYTKGVKGKMRGEDALRIILRDTGLRFERFNRAVVVRRSIRSASRVQRHAALSEPRDLWDGEEAPRVELLGNMVVTGTHIQDAEPIGSPMLVMDSQTINSTGYASVQDVIRSLPQNFAGGPSEDTAAGNDGNVARSSAVNLRGLGAGATLVLLNGHRLATGGTSDSFVDISSIPLAAIERIEVMSDGASAVYGADAVGGVVNFILKSDYDGAETTARLGSVTTGSMLEWNASQLVGTRWDSGHALLSFDYQNRGNLPARDRTLSADSDLRRLGGSDFSSVLASPGNILAGGQVYPLIPGVAAAGITPGRANLQNLNYRRDLLSAQERRTGYFIVEQSLGPVSLTADALLSHRKSLAINVGVPTTLTIPISNPFRVIPPGVASNRPYQLQYNFVDVLGPRTAEARVDTRLLNGTALFDAGRDWEVSLTLSNASENINQVQRNSFNSAAVAAALADPDPSTSLNVFGGVPNNPATLERIRRSAFYASESGLATANISANGTMLALPAGRVKLAAGAEYRAQRFSTQNQSPDALSISRVPELQRDVASAYAELLVPVLTNLRASLAGRYDRYDDFGSQFSPRLGVEWAPIGGVALHGSWGRSFKAPNLPDLSERGNLSYVSEASNGGGGVSPVLFVFGGNSDLHPEQSRIWTLGLQWQPNALATLDLSYWDIDFRGRVQSPGFTEAFLIDPRYAAIVYRDPSPALRERMCESMFIGNLSSTPGDCLSAPISAIVDERWNNVARTITRGIDLTGSWSMQARRMGYFTFTSNVSYVLAFEERQSETSEWRDILDTATNPLRFKTRNSVSWTRSGFGVTAAVNYAGGYDDPVSSPARSVSSWTTVDLQLRYEVDPREQGWLSGCVFALSVQNVADRDPPFFNNPAGVGYDRENADLLKRFLSASIEKRW
jgi:outer membrane receptor protein involved in Fe transport